MTVSRVAAVAQSQSVLASETALRVLRESSVSDAKLAFNWDRRIVLWRLGIRRSIVAPDMAS